MNKMALAAILALVVVVVFAFVLRRAGQRKIRESLWRFRKIPEVMIGMDPFTFELWVRQLFLDCGASAALSKREQKTGFDHGIDLIVRYQGQKICVQCKKYYSSNMVNETVLRDLYGAKFHGGYDKAIIVTTSKFTNRSLTWAEGKKDMILINGDLLQKLRDEPKLLVELLNK